MTYAHGMARPTSPCWGLPHAIDHPLLDKLRHSERLTSAEIETFTNLDNVKSAVGVVMQWYPVTPGGTPADDLEVWKGVLRRLLRRRRRPKTEPAP